MNPESGSLMRVVAYSVITSGFSKQRSASGFKLTKKTLPVEKRTIPVRLQETFLLYGLN